MSRWTLLERQADQFAHPQTRGVEQLQDRPVAQGERILGFVGQPQQLVDILPIENARNVLPLLGRLDQRGDVLVHVPVVMAVSQEQLDRDQPPGNRRLGQPGGFSQDRP